MTEKSHNRCECDVSKNLIESHLWPLEKNEHGDVVIVSVDKNRSTLARFCLWCGGDLRDTPSSDNPPEKIQLAMEKIESILETAKSVGELIDQLGKPDEILEDPLANSEGAKYYDIKPVARQLTYYQVTEGVSLTIIENKDGTFYPTLGEASRKGK